MSAGKETPYNTIFVYDVAHTAAWRQKIYKKIILVFFWYFFSLFFLFFRKMRHRKNFPPFISFFFLSSFHEIMKFIFISSLSGTSAKFHNFLLILLTSNYDYYFFIYLFFGFLISRKNLICFHYRFLFINSLLSEQQYERTNCYFMTLLRRSKKKKKSYKKFPIFVIFLF